MTKKAVENYMFSAKKPYRFCANSDFPMWLNIENDYGQISPTDYLGRPTDAVFHNLCKNTQAPPGIRLIIYFIHCLDISLTRTNLGGHLSISILVPKGADLSTSQS